MSFRSAAHTLCASLSTTKKKKRIIDRELKTNRRKMFADDALEHCLRILSTKCAPNIELAISLPNSKISITRPEKAEKVVEVVLLQAHWFFLVIDYAEKAVTFYDSARNYSRIGNLYRQCINQRLNNRHVQGFAFKQDTTATQQRNGHDCGAFVVLNVAHFVLANRVPRLDKCSLVRELAIEFLESEDHVKLLERIAQLEQESSRPDIFIAQ